MSILNALGGVLSHFNFLDYCFVGMLIVAMLVGGFKGFCKQLVSWFFWILAGYISYFYSFGLAERWFGSTFSSPIVCVLAVNFILFGSAFLTSFLLNRFMQGVLSVTGLSVFDRFLGVYFGLVQGVFLIAIVVTGFSSTGVKDETWWKRSRVVVMTSTLMPIYAEDMIRLLDRSFSNINQAWMDNLGGRFTWEFDQNQQDE